MLHITIVTLFPDMFKGPFDESILKRARLNHFVNIDYVNVRDFATDQYKSVDDRPYGGGHGMIMRVDIIDKALQSAKKLHKGSGIRTILLDPQGTPYSQGHAKRLSIYQDLILICGHYESIDERVRSLVDEEISIGDYILTGGEIPAMVLVDSIVRLIPGVLKRNQATVDESFSLPLLEYPQYTRPEVYKKQKVPSVLLSGDHTKIDAWRKDASVQRTKLRRPDLVPVKNH